MAIIFAIILGSIIILLGIAYGFRKASAGIPAVGSCSAAISAACHPPKTDVNVSSKSVMWGAMAAESINDSDDSIGHCCLTSFEVEAPIVGRMYAGDRTQ